MPREIEHHKCPGLNEKLKIVAVDDPGPGGANHEYNILWNNNLGALHRTTIKFQKGGIEEVVGGGRYQTGVNGGSIEALLAVSADRLECFQAGEFACDDNAEALTHILAAIECLHRRTKDRVRRGVEGKEVA